jgi:transcriptional regulator with XRE-family HTH domain
MENKRKKELLECLSREVRTKRDRLNLTQAVLAEMADLSIRALQEIEHGKSDPQISSVVSLSSALGTPINTMVNLPNKSDLIVEIVRRLPALDELQLRSVLKLASTDESDSVINTTTKGSISSKVIK